MLQTTSYREVENPTVVSAIKALVTPGRGHLGCKEVLATLAFVPGAKLGELSSLPLGTLGQRLMALRYFIVNGTTWLRYFAWEAPLARVAPEGPAHIKALWARIEHVRSTLPSEGDLTRYLETGTLEEIGAEVEGADTQTDRALTLLVALGCMPTLAQGLSARLSREMHGAAMPAPRVRDILYLASHDLSRFPATTVGEGNLHYLIVADKGEMGVRAVREAIAFGVMPVVLFSARDDARSLQRRLAEEHGGFGISLQGSFRESYASYAQIAERVHEVYKERFQADAERELARSALYPGYGPLAENTAAIEHFRRHGIVFVGPMQDVVERAGDKRKFRLLAQSIDANAVVPGIVIDDHDPALILASIEAGYAEGRFSFPGRLKAANGGGGRGQMVIPSPEFVQAAVQKVLSEIQTNGWDRGVMFEQNIPETIHLEVQVLRDRYGNTRHFGMRDCTEQRASQKIQEEAPPALMRLFAGLEERICALAVRIADEVGYVGACTVELMFKDGHYYLLEMNTRIQVEHPVTEAAHRIRTEAGLAPLNLVALQLAIANGAAIPFAQSDVINTHAAREFRINAESFRADIKDSRDGKHGLFLPNAGVFDTIEIPAAADVHAALEARAVRGISDLQVRFDCGFEAGDVLVNKDPTFGKLIVSVATDPSHTAERYELLRLASIEVLRRTRIEGRQVLPTGKVIPRSQFATNLTDHVRVLESEVLREHSTGLAKGRHVNWVIEALRRS